MIISEERRYADATEQRNICLHCKCPQRYRNLSGDCDHLHWPDNLTAEAKRANGILE